MRILRTYGLAVVCVAALAVTLLAAAIAAAVGRSAAAGARTITVTDAASAYRAFLASRARGRELVVFDTHSNVVDDAHVYRRSMAGEPIAPPDETRLTSELMVAGIARKVLVIVPDTEWPRTRAVLGAAKDVLPEGAGFRRRFAGMPVEFVPASSAPRRPSDGRVLVFVSGPAVADYPPALLAAWTSADRADLVVRQEAR